MQNRFDKIGLKRYPLVAFFVLTYAISWALWAPSALSISENELFRVAGGFGPTLAALLLTLTREGWDGLRQLLKRLLIWRVNVVWYAISLFGTAVIVALGIGLYVLLGGSRASFSDPQPWHVAFIAFPYVLLTSVLGEEIGWRGYALPRLQARHSALDSSLILGLVWNLWHLPLFAMAGNFHQDLPLSLFLLQSLVLTLLMTWVYNHTRGSLLMAHLFHTASNVTFFMLPILPTETGGTLRPLWLALGIACAITLVIVWVYGPERLAHGPIPRTPSDTAPGEN